MTFERVIFVKIKQKKELGTLKKVSNELN